MRVSVELRSSHKGGAASRARTALLLLVVAASAKVPNRVAALLPGAAHATPSVKTASASGGASEHEQDAPLELEATSTARKLAGRKGNSKGEKPHVAHVEPVPAFAEGESELAHIRHDDLGAHAPAVYMDYPTAHDLGAFQGYDSPDAHSGYHYDYALHDYDYDHDAYPMPSYHIYEGIYGPPISAPAPLIYYPPGHYLGAYGDPSDAYTLDHDYPPPHYEYDFYDDLHYAPYPVDYHYVYDDHYNAPIPEGFDGHEVFEGKGEGFVYDEPSRDHPCGGVPGPNEGDDGRFEGHGEGSAGIPCF